MQKYYRTLGLEYDAPLSEVRKAYRDLVQVWHPDRFVGNERLCRIATEKLVEINEAYRMIRTIVNDESSASCAAPPQSAGEPIDWTSIASDHAPIMESSPLMNSQRAGFHNLSGPPLNVVVGIVIVSIVVILIASR